MFSLNIENELQRRLKGYAVYLSVFAVLIATGVLTGWAFDIHFLKYPFPRLVAMNPMTAIGIVLAGAGLGFIDKGKLITGRIIAIAIALIGVFKLLAIDTGLDIGIDRWFFTKSVLTELVNGMPNSMAPNTAICFLLLGVSVLFTSLNNSFFRATANYLCAVVLVVGIFSLIGYLYGVKEFYGFLNFIPMSFLTAICFAFIAMTVLVFNSRFGFMQTLTSTFSGGIMARLLIPAVILIPAVLGYFRIWSSHRISISVELGVALLITSIIVFFLVIVWYLSIALNKSDKARSDAEESLRKFTESLEQTISDRTKELSDYQFALDESSIVAVTDQYGIIKHANDNFCKISKYSKVELIGQDHRIISSGYHTKEFIRDLWATIAKGKIWRGELKNKAKDGTHYWVDTTIVPFLNEHGKPYQYVAIRADITARKIADEAFHELNTQLEQRVLERTAELESANKEIARRNIHFDQTHDVFLIVNFEGSFIDFNSGFETQLGYSRSELLSIPYMELLHPDDVASSELEMAKIATEGFTKNFENRFRCQSGDYIWYQWNVVVYEGLIFAVGRDVSKQKEQQVALSIQSEKLNQVNKELESFSYSVSHDLRAPLRAVHGYAQILSEDYGEKIDDEGKRIMGNIMSNAKKMGLLIDDLLSFSRLGRKELVKMKMQMQSMVESICTELNDNPTNQYKVEFTIHNLPSVFADALTIKQVWLNLISNALKYSGKREKIIIEIGAEEKSDEVIFYIKDNGVGFDMRYVSKLFGVFQRLHSDDEFEGTGVGLAIVQRIVAKHGGKVWAESELNKGATFYFSLPK